MNHTCSRFALDNAIDAPLEDCNSRLGAEKWTFYCSSCQAYYKPTCVKREKEPKKLRVMIPEKEGNDS